MALIRCTECGREISDKAETCPGCGAPVINPDHPRVTTQQTGKNVKLQMLIAMLMIVGGIVGCIANAQNNDSTAIWSGLIAILGFFWWLIARILGWWQYG